MLILHSFSRLLASLFNNNGIGHRAVQSFRAFLFFSVLSQGPKEATVSTLD